MSVAQQKDLEASDGPRRRGWWRWFGRAGEMQVSQENRKTGGDPLMPPVVLRPATAVDMFASRRSLPKARLDMADLLVMSTVDGKAPAESPGAVDLLDA